MKRAERGAEEIVDAVLEEFEKLTGKEKKRFVERNLTREVKRAAGVLKHLEGEEASRDFLVLYTLLCMTEKRMRGKTSQVFKVACAMYGVLKGKRPREILDYIA